MTSLKYVSNTPPPQKNSFCQPLTLSLCLTSSKLLGLQYVTSYETVVTVRYFKSNELVPYELYDFLSDASAMEGTSSENEANAATTDSTDTSKEDADAMDEEPINDNDQPSTSEDAPSVTAEVVATAEEPTENAATSSSSATETTVPSKNDDASSSSDVKQDKVEESSSQVLCWSSNSVAFQQKNSLSVFLTNNFSSSVFPNLIEAAKQSLILGEHLESAPQIWFKFVIMFTLSTVH